MIKKQRFNLASPLLYILLGALLVIFKAQMLNWAMTFAGLFFLLIGLIDLIKGRAPSGIVNLAIAAIIIILGWTIMDVVLRVLGVLVAAKGVMDLIAVMKFKKKKILAIVFAAITIAIGVMLALTPDNVLSTVMKFAGILLIIDGIIGLIGARRLR